MSMFVHGRAGKHHVSHFPVRHCSAYTTHRLQGLEAEDGLAVGALKASSLNNIYVLLSRVRTWSKLFILPNLKLTKKSLTVPAHSPNHAKLVMLRKENSRLQQLAAKTKSLYNAANCPYRPLINKL